jgi:hypothetical protein
MCQVCCGFAFSDDLLTGIQNHCMRTIRRLTCCEEGFLSDKKELDGVSDLYGGFGLDIGSEMEP